MRMWKKPDRPKNKITQSLSDGYVRIYTATDTAEPGRKPVIKLAERLCLRYDEQRLGISRYYAGRQNQIQIDRVIRVPDAGKITNQDVAITQDGMRYRIDFVQIVAGVSPPCVDLTLYRDEREAST